MLDNNQSAWTIALQSSIGMSDFFGVVDMGNPLLQSSCPCKSIATEHSTAYRFG